MSCGAVHNFIIIFHLGNTIAFLLHFAALQCLNHLPTTWIFDQGSAELCGHAEKATCKETRQKFNLGLCLRPSQLQHPCHLCVRCVVLASSTGSAGFPCEGPQLRFWGSFFHQLGASAIGFVLPSQFQSTGQRQLILGRNCETCTSHIPGEPA